MPACALIAFDMNAVMLALGGMVAIIVWQMFKAR